jgi:predicted  nucleic acid-binding Zn-ribbon protein
MSINSLTNVTDEKTLPKQTNDDLKINSLYALASILAESANSLDENGSDCIGVTKQIKKLMNDFYNDITTFNKEIVKLRSEIDVLASQIKNLRDKINELQERLSKKGSGMSDPSYHGKQPEHSADQDELNKLKGELESRMKEWDGKTSTLMKCRDDLMQKVSDMSVLKSKLDIFTTTTFDTTMQQLSVLINMGTVVVESYFKEIKN